MTDLPRRNDHRREKVEAALRSLVAERDFFRVRMMVAVTFLDSDTLDKFHEHVAAIDAKHKEASRV